MSIRRPNKEQNHVHKATEQRPGIRASQMAEQIGLAAGRQTGRIAAHIIALAIVNNRRLPTRQRINEERTRQLVDQENQFIIDQLSGDPTRLTDANSAFDDEGFQVLSEITNRSGLQRTRTRAASRIARQLGPEAQSVLNGHPAVQAEARRIANQEGYIVARRERRREIERLRRERRTGNSHDSHHPIR